MPTRRAPKHKISRRFGIDIYGTGGDSLARRLDTPPGGLPRNRRRRRSTEYGLQLNEKQKVKAIYGVAEGQFRRYFEEASRQPGIVGENLLRLLERRLDNVVYRLGYARTRPMARQLVGHGHVQVNGRRVDIPSYLVETGQSISLGGRARNMPTVEEELATHRPVPRWLELQDGTGHVRGMPERSDIDMPIHEEQVVNFYSR